LDLFFSVSHAYSELKKQDSKDWMKKRIFAMAVIIVFCLMFIWGSYSMLLQDNLENAYRLAITSFMILIALSIECMMLLTIREAERYACMRKRKNRDKLKN
jgi:TRAP-type C4-dicarboxylate transport system permease small subunit